MLWWKSTPFHAQRHGKIQKRSLKTWITWTHGTTVLHMSHPAYTDSTPRVHNRKAFSALVKEFNHRHLARLGISHSHHRHLAHLGCRTYLLNRLTYSINRMTNRYSCQCLVHRLCPYTTQLKPNRRSRYIIQIAHHRVHDIHPPRRYTTQIAHR